MTRGEYSPKTSKCAEVNVQPPSYDSIMGGASSSGDQDHDPDQNPDPAPDPEAVRTTAENTPQGTQQPSSNFQKFLSAEKGARFKFISCCFFFALSFAAMIIGAVYFKECPVNTNVSVWLVVYGVVSSIFNTIIGLEEYAFSIRKRISFEEREKSKPEICHVFQWLLGMFMIGFFIFGCVTVFGVASRVQFQNQTFNDTMTDNNMVNSTTIETIDLYCNPVVYYYAFSFLVTALCYIGLIILMAVLIEWGKWLCK